MWWTCCESFRNPHSCRSSASKPADRSNRLVFSLPARVLLCDSGVQILCGFLRSGVRLVLLPGTSAHLLCGFLRLRLWLAVLTRSIAYLVSGYLRLRLRVFSLPRRLFVSHSETLIVFEILRSGLLVVFPARTSA